MFLAFDPGGIRRIIIFQAKLFTFGDAKWFCQARGLSVVPATLAEMGRRFSVTGATLGQAIRHHRSVTPNLFNLTDLPGLEGRNPDKTDLFGTDIVS